MAGVVAAAARAAGPARAAAASGYGGMRRPLTAAIRTTAAHTFESANHQTLLLVRPARAANGHVELGNAGLTAPSLCCQFHYRHNGSTSSGHRPGRTRSFLVPGLPALHGTPPRRGRARAPGATYPRLRMRHRPQPQRVTAIRPRRRHRSHVDGPGLRASERGERAIAQATAAAASVRRRAASTS